MARKKTSAKDSVRGLKFFCVTVLVVLGGGCSSLPSLSSLNPFSSNDVPRNPPAPLVGISQASEMRTAWTAAVGPAGAYSFVPAVTDDGVYAAARDGALLRLEKASGRVVWKINAGRMLTAGVGSDGKTIVVAGSEGRIMAFDPDGKPRWTSQASSEVLSAPAIGDGVVIVRSQDNRILGLDAQTGDRKWAIQKTSPPLTLRATPGILIKGPNAYIALAGGKLLSVVVATGAPRWEAAVGEARGATELERIIDTSGMPVSVDRDVCAVSYQGRAMCFDAVAGTPLWAKDLSSEVGLGADDRFVYASDATGAVLAMGREAGASVWRNTQLRYRGLSSPVAYGQSLVVGDYQGYLHFLNREDGAMISRIATDGSAVTGPPIVAGSQLIVQTRAGSVVGLAPR